jgi:hypothetical protein
MTAPVPLRYEGEGEFQAPTGHWCKRADAEFVIGEVYQMAEIEHRSWASHAHEFAWLKEAWLQLPDDVAPLYPSPEHLRKRALIEAGYYHETAIDCGSNAAALRVAAYVRAKDEFALAIVRGPLVIERTAKSQSRRAMGKQDFQESKSAIMDVIAEMIGTTPDDLQRNAGRAA